MAAPATNGSSSLFSANELQALDGFFNWQLMPQAQPQAAASSSVSYARTSAPPPSSANYSYQHSYYPTNGIVQSTLLKQGPAKAPSITSDASERIETPQERDKRMKAQADDLASWLAQYNTSGPVPSTSTPAIDARRASAQPASLQTPAHFAHGQDGMPQRRSFSGSPERSTLQADYVAASGCVTSSAADTFRHPNLPASHPSVGTSGGIWNSSINGRRKSQDMHTSDNRSGAQDGSMVSKRQRQSAGGSQDVSTLSGPVPAFMRQESAPISMSDEEQDMPEADMVPALDSRTAKGKGKARGKASAAPKKTKATFANKAAKRSSVSAAPLAATAGGRRTNGKVKAEQDVADADLQMDEGTPSLNAGIDESLRTSASPAEAAGSTAVQRSSSSKVDTGPKVVLTEEQKRANHIASEQKRRTAIRLAYDELCNVVPSLSSAVKEYEERLSKLQQGAGGAAAGEGTVAGALTGGIDVGGEKVDGRAGPKSEAVVLGKSTCFLRFSLSQWEANDRFR